MCSQIHEIAAACGRPFAHCCSPTRSMMPPYTFTVTPPPLNYVTIGDLDHMHEVLLVKQRLSKIGIFLEGFGIKITGVYTRPRPYGFDFDCQKPRELLALAGSKAKGNTAVLNEDKDTTRGGRFSSAATHGTGFRQIGSGAGLHLEIAMDGKCNVHVDSHGYVTGPGQYDWLRSL